MYDDKTVETADAEELRLMVRSLQAVPVERVEREAVAEVIPNVVGIEMAWIDPWNKPPVGTKLYTTPQPAPPHPARRWVLVEALKRVYLTRDERLRAGFLCAAHWDNAVLACIEVVEKHFANHQSGGANND